MKVKDISDLADDAKKGDLIELFAEEGGTIALHYIRKIEKGYHGWGTILLAGFTVITSSSEVEYDHPFILDIQGYLRAENGGKHPARKINQYKVLSRAKFP